MATKLSREVSFGQSVSLNEGADLVQHCGEDVSFVFQGEMGIGKSYMLYELGKRMPQYTCMYAEMPTFDVSDMSGVPFTETINGVKVTRFAPNAMLNIQGNNPVLFMADEIGKAMRPVQNSVLRLLHEKKVGEYSLPPGSIVFGTTNLSAEGLGDHVQSHAQNRVSFITVRKPTADEWLPWASDNGIHPVISSWVKKFPMCLASHTDGDGNPYIYYPHKTTRAFVTPRSLHKASHILWKRKHLSDNAAAAAIAGCVGESAARDIMSFAQVDDRLPAWETIVNTPSKALVPSPEDFAANYITVFSALMLVDAKSFDAWLEYCERLPKEYQGVFAMNIVTTNKRDLAHSNRAFIKWATTNEWMI
jgi:hypothetical protein